MDHYLEIRVLPDPEFNAEMLLAALSPNFIVRWALEEKGISVSAFLTMAPHRAIACDYTAALLP